MRISAAGRTAVQIRGRPGMVALAPWGVAADGAAPFLSAPPLR
jgi:hypothetical protein